MQKIVAACGLLCNECLAYKATLADDDNLRETTAQFWSTIYGTHHTKEDIVCQGCMTPGSKYAHCQKCDFRLCAQQKKLQNCAECPDYPCEKLAQFLENLPTAKLVLDELRKENNTK